MVSKLLQGLQSNDLQIEFPLQVCGTYEALIVTNYALYAIWSIWVKILYIWDTSKIQNQKSRSYRNVTSKRNI